MARGNDWNSFMQDKPMRVLLNALCTVFCGYHAIGAVVDLVRPGEASQMLAEQMGQTGYVVMTVVRLAVMIWAAVMFLRMAISALKEDDEDE